MDEYVIKMEINSVLNTCQLIFFENIFYYFTI